MYDRCTIIMGGEREASLVSLCETFKEHPICLYRSNLWTVIIASGVILTIISTTPSSAIGQLIVVMYIWAVYIYMQLYVTLYIGHGYTIDQVCVKTGDINCTIIYMQSRGNNMTCYFKRTTCSIKNTMVMGCMVCIVFSEVMNKELPYLTFQCASAIPNLAQNMCQTYLECDRQLLKTFSMKQRHILFKPSRTGCPENFFYQIIVYT